MFTCVLCYRKALICLALSVALSLTGAIALAVDLPTSNITDPVDGAALPASLGSYSIKGVASDSGAGLQKVEVSFDGGTSWEAAYDKSGNGSLSAWEYAWTPLPLGNYSIMSRATDNLGGVEYPGPGTHVIIDGNSPMSSVTSPAAGVYIAGATCVITGVADDGSGSGVASVEVSTNGGASWLAASGTTNWSYTWTLPADGVYTILSRATDAASNIESPGTAVTVTVDNTPPSSAITSPSAGEYVGGSLYPVTGTADDGTGSGVQTVEVSTDGGATWNTVSGTASWNFSWSVPADGTYTILSRATDAASNIETPGAGVAVTVDKTPPASSVIDPTDGAAVNVDFYDISGVAHDGTGSGVVNVDVSVDGGQTWSAASDTSGDGTLSNWAFHWAPLPLGNHSITVRATDDAGNIGTPAVGVHLLVDRTPPTSSITEPVDGGYIGGVSSYTVTGTAGDTGGSGVQMVEVSIDGGAWQPAAGTGIWSYSWAVPADGSHTITVRARDVAGNTETPGAGITVIVDKTPPASQVTDPTDGAAVNVDSYDISGVADDGTGSGVVNVDVSVDGGQTWSAASDTSGDGTLSNWAFHWAPLPLGNHSITVRATDDAGNIETPAAGVHLLVDRTPPVSSVGFPADGAALTGQSCTVTGSSSDTGGATVDRVEVSTDGGATWSAAEGTAEWSYVWTIASDGVYSIMCRAVDIAGNVETPLAGVAVTVDNTPPASVIASPTAGEYIGGTVYTVTGTADDGSGTGVQAVEISIDGGPWQSAVGTDSWSYAWTLPSDGSYTINSRAVDAAGNVETPGAGITVNVDNTPPASSITSPTDGAYIGGSVYTITGTSDDGTGSGVSTVEVSTDGGLTWNTASGTGSWSYTWTLSADGTYSIRSRATDVAGNEEAPGAGVSVTVDTIPPSSAITDPEVGAFVGGSATYTIAGAADDSTGSGVTMVEVSTDGGVTWNTASGTVSWNYSWTLPVDGSYTIMSRAADNAGNTETPGPGIAVTVDTTPPTGSIELKSGRYTKARTVHLTLSARDAGSNCPEPDPVMCEIDMMQLSDDGVNWLAWEAPSTDVSWHFSKGDGEKSVFVHYRDMAGNVSEDYVVTAIVDTVNPVSAVTSPADGSVIVTPVTTVSGTAEDGGSGVALVEVSTDGGSSWTAAEGTTSWTYQWTPASDGSYNIQSRATDNAGNVESPGAGVTVTVSLDSIPPTGSVSINSGAQYTNSTDIVLALTADDAGSGVSDMRISTDGVFDTETWETYAASRNLTLDTGDGVKDVYVVYRDAAGNESTVYTDEITLDTAPPAGSVIIDGGAEFTHTTTVALGVDASDELSGVTQMQISEDGLFDTEPWESYASARSYDLSAAEGVKTVYVRFMDTASNVSAMVSDNINLSYDTDTPVSSISAPADGEYISSVTYIVSGTASDAGTGVSKVEVSTDGGVSWTAAAGGATWTYSWVLPVQGTRTIMCRATDNAGNTETPAAGVAVFVTAYGSPELAHYNWDAAISGDCAACHMAQGAFLQPGYKSEPGFCGACHNASGVAHESCTYNDRSHSIMSSVTTVGCVMPVYGNITSGEYDNRPFAHLLDGDKVVCATCHNTMQKPEDYGRVWEMTTTGDNITYTLARGGWSAYGYMEPKVYRDSALWTGPAYVRDKKAYLVDGSEYTYDEDAGTVTFSAAQDPLVYVYVSLDYPYLRASSQDNRLCADCHTQATHMGANCLACHQAHNTANLAGIRENVRTADHTGQPVSFLGYSGVGSFADGDGIHNGICEVCHAQTLYHKSDGSGSPHNEGGDCTGCHSHASGFAK